MNTNSVVTKNEELYSILNGPNKDALFDACKYAYNENAQISINFVVMLGHTMPLGHPGDAIIAMAIRHIQITSIEHEDGSGESFNLAGYCEADLRSVTSKVTYRPHRFTAYYNTKTRNGSISFD